MNLRALFGPIHMGSLLRRFTGPFGAYRAGNGDPPTLDRRALRAAAGNPHPL